MHDEVSIAIQDRARLAALARTRLLDTLPEDIFDRLSRLASRLLNTPVAMVTLIGRDRQFVKSCVGLPEPAASERHLPFSHSFCKHLVVTGEPLILGDAREHPVHRENLAVLEMGAVAYAGVPLRTAEGHVIGSFCAIDTRPREWTDEEVQVLTDLAASVISEIEWRRYATERDEAEAALQAREAQFRAVFDEAAIGIALVDDSGRLVRSNRALQEMLGYTAEELKGVMFSWITHPDDLAADWELFGELVAGERRDYQMEKRYFHRDGSVVCGRLSVSLLRSEGHESQLAIGMVENITEQKAAEEALEQSRGQLLQAQKMEAVGRLAGGIAHDFNNLLTVILGNAQMLLMDLPSDPAAEIMRLELEEIQQGGQRAAELTRQLLAFSRKQLLHPDVLDLNTVFAATDRLLRRLLGEDVEVRTTFTPDLGRVRADPGQIEQVLVNFAVNARDAMPRGGRLTIATDNVVLSPAEAPRFAVEPGRYVRFSVGDTGEGMDPETQAHIFEPFFTTKEPGKGTGLGLSTVYGIVRQSGGFVRVQSEPGRGTTFEVYLPEVDEVAEVRDE
ncbi:MAG: PAS domain S-box protein, partial [Gemmatimonadetes bacterium]|nr:PAS domain S-box protein [Gemmatimonadota bacterium]